MKSFNEITSSTKTVPGTVLVVDAFNLAFRWKHQKALFFKEEYLNTIESLKKSYKADKVVICSDWGSSSYRKEILPEYKYERKLLREDQSEEDAAYFEKFFEEFISTLEYIKEVTEYPILRFQGVEADDIVAHLVTHRKEYGFSKLWLISTDKDFDLLCNEDTSRFSYITRKEVTFENWSEHYKWTPEQYISIKCLMGDKGDSVPGVLKIGPITAHKLVEQYGSALDIADAMPLPGKYVYIKNLNEFGADNLMRNYQLMDLISFCDDALGIENINTIKEQLHNAVNH